jgi:hypothetical protein
MKNLKIILLAVVFLWFGISGASGAFIDLYGSGLNIDGVISSPSLGATGLGTIQVIINTVGAHNVDLFVDHEIDEPDNTWWNETGSATGAPAAGQSWEIDEPGWFDGDIYENFLASTLDNQVGISTHGDTYFPDDVSMAMGWDFTLAADETAIVRLILSETMPMSGFYLTHTDPDSPSPASIYFSSTLEIDGNGTQPIPEPTTLLLVGIGLVGLLGFGRKKFRNQS